MKNNYVTRFSNAKKFLVAMLLLVCPLSFTYAACCAGHGGVAYCNKTTGVQMCKDGTASPSCKCPKAKEPKTKATPATTSKSTTTKPKTKSSATKSTTSSKPAATRAKTSNSASHKGCCSKHGGIAQCNKSTGFLKCKDGSQSATCGCN